MYSLYRQAQVVRDFARQAPSHVLEIEVPAELRERYDGPVQLDEIARDSGIDFGELFEAHGAAAADGQRPLAHTGACVGETFRVDRIADKVSNGRRFLPRPIPEGDLASYVSRSVSLKPYTYQARIVLHAPLDAMAQRIPPTTGQLKKIDVERCRLETGSHSLASLGLHLAMLGVDFDVEEPLELAQYLRVLATRLSRAASTHA